MKDKINVAELLKDCPKGMELDCTAYDNVSFDKISGDKKANYPIYCYITDEEGNRSSISFTENGCESKRYGAKCVIFPKGKTTWEGFEPPCPFKDGDVVTTLVKNSYVFYSIYKNIEDKKIMTYVDYCPNGDRIYNFNGVLCFANQITEQRLSTEEEKQKLFDSIKDNGYKWNPETKTLEKLIVPNFKVGDKIKNKDTVLTIRSVEEKSYIVEDKPDNFGILMFSQQDKWELVPNKFDINTLVPFESKVLVRNSYSGFWVPTFWGIYEAEKTNEHQYRNYLTTKGFFRHCIPYNDDTKHLLGTTNDCDDYYKTWD